MAISAPLAHELDGGHAEVHVRRGPRSGLLVAVAIHRTVRGTSLGGCRIKAYASDEEAVADVERLAAAMTLKAAAAGLPVGGGKGVIALPEGPVDPKLRRQALRDFAELVDDLGGRYVTAQDVGTTLEDIVLLRRYTPHVAGRPREQGGSGDPGPFTALGVEIAIRASLSRPLSGSHIVVAGLGNVGGRLAIRLSRAGARLTVTDVDESLRPLAEFAGAHWVKPSHVLEVEADLFSPCALGGILDAETVPRLGAPVVAGAANNQLADDSVAGLLRARGIRWAPDFIVNAGGLIAVCDERAHHRFHAVRAERRIAAIADTLATVYTRAENDHTDTLQAARAIARERADQEENRT